MKIRKEIINEIASNTVIAHHLPSFEREGDYHPVHGETILRIYHLFYGNTIVL